MFRTITSASRITSYNVCYTKLLRAEHEKKFLTLDGESRQLSKDILLIWDEEKPVALAGIMGGMNTEVSSGTVNVLLESAYFNPSSVRRTSKGLNISTESVITSYSIHYTKLYDVQR